MTNGGYERVGRLVFDVGLDESDLYALRRAIDKHTNFTASRSTVMRIDLLREVSP